MIGVIDGERQDQFAYSTSVYIGETLCGKSGDFDNNQIGAADEIKVISVRCKKPIWGTDVTIRKEGFKPLGFYSIAIKSVGGK